jgi:hypothetical protein
MMPPPRGNPFDTVIFFIKSKMTTSALTQLRPVLAVNQMLVTLQNGMGNTEVLLAGPNAIVSRTPQNTGAELQSRLPAGQRPRTRGSAPSRKSALIQWVKPSLRRLATCLPIQPAAQGSPASPVIWTGRELGTDRRFLW